MKRASKLTLKLKHERESNGQPEESSKRKHKYDDPPQGVSVVCLDLTVKPETYFLPSQNCSYQWDLFRGPT